jgi:hypothetical protein
LLQLLQNGAGHGHRVEYLDGRHRRHLTEDLLRPLICEAPEKTARGRSRREQWMVTASELAGFIAADAIWCVSDADGRDERR